MMALLSVLIFLAACAPDLTDDQIATAASAPFDKRGKMGRHEVLGEVGGIKVVADYYCSDVCPAYTVRVVHLDVKPGPDCDKVGGVAKSYSIPIGIAARPQSFCVPKVLAQRDL
jgi:hypothetical protein